MSYELLLTKSLLICISLASLKPAKSASYSVTLFVALKLNLMAQFNLCPSELSRTIPTSEPTSLDEPFRKRLHFWSSGKFRNKICKSLSIDSTAGLEE